MTHGRKSQVSLPGAAEAVNTANHWFFRGDPRETAKTWTSDFGLSDLETWFSQDYDDRLRFTTLVDPRGVERYAGRELKGFEGQRLPPLGASPFPWKLIALITGFAKGCLERRPCRTLLLRNIREEWFDLSREVLGEVDMEEVSDLEYGFGGNEDHGQAQS